MKIHKIDEFERQASNLSIEEVGYTDYEADYKDAKELAAKYHGEQKYGEHLYTKHLQDVENVLRRFGYDPDIEDVNDPRYHDQEYRILAWDLITAAWLHDIVEDTIVTKSQVGRKFNHRVASLVYAVTNPQGGNRAWRASKVYPKIVRTPHALALKLADRIANVESCVQTGSSLINMYAKEWDEFQSKYRVKDEYDEMWKHLERVIRENKQYKKPKKNKK